ncbi:hypothetical protein FKW77_001959 [Venturia effusa]|uniref:Uncharacterized protein n=1 Tax=Venturia effusa TaxID=50376 RepID=A0A517LRF8_9PEZI|nr:hypothetical protein FKW77_001959 [Venturia effusa]
MMSPRSWSHDQHLTTFWRLISQPQVVEQILSSDPPNELDEEHVRRLQHIVDHLQGTLNTEREEVEEAVETRRQIVGDWPQVFRTANWAPILGLASLQTPIFFDRIIANHGATLSGARAFIRGTSIEYDNWMRSQDRPHDQGDAINAMSHLVHNLNHQVAQNRVVYGFSMIVHHEIGLALRAKDTHTGMFTKKMRLTLTRILRQIEPNSLPEAIEKRVTDIAQWAKRGHHLRVLTDWYGMGILFYLSDLLRLHDFERVIPKSGSEFEAAAQHLYELNAPKECEKSKANALAHFVIQDMMAPFIETMAKPPPHLVSNDTRHAAPWLEFPIQRSGIASKLETRPRLQQLEKTNLALPSPRPSNCGIGAKPSSSREMVPDSITYNISHQLVSPAPSNPGGFAPSATYSSKISTPSLHEVQRQLATDLSERDGILPTPRSAWRTKIGRADDRMTVGNPDAIRPAGIHPNPTQASMTSTIKPRTKRKAEFSSQPSDRNGFPPSTTSATKTITTNKRADTKKTVTKPKARPRSGKEILAKRLVH